MRSIPPPLQDPSGTPALQALTTFNPSLVPKLLAALSDDDASAAICATDSLWKQNVLHVAAALPDKQRCAALEPLVDRAGRLGLVGAFMSTNGKGQLPSAVTKNKRVKDLLKGGEFLARQVVAERERRGRAEARKEAERDQGQERRERDGEEAGGKVEAEGGGEGQQKGGGGEVKRQTGRRKGRGQRNRPAAAGAAAATAIARRRKLPSRRRKLPSSCSRWRRRRNGRYGWRYCWIVWALHWRQLRRGTMRRCGVPPPLRRARLALRRARMRSCGAAWRAWRRRGPLIRMCRLPGGWRRGVGMGTAGWERRGTRMTLRRKMMGRVAWGGMGR